MPLNVKSTPFPQGRAAAQKIEPDEIQFDRYKANIKSRVDMSIPTLIGKQNCDTVTRAFCLPDSHRRDVEDGDVFLLF